MYELWAAEGRIRHFQPLRSKTDFPFTFNPVATRDVMGLGKSPGLKEIPKMKIQVPRFTAATEAQKAARPEHRITK